MKTAEEFRDKFAQKEYQYLDWNDLCEDLWNKPAMTIAEDRVMNAYAKYVLESQPQQLSDEKIHDLVIKNSERIQHRDMDMNIIRPSVAIKLMKQIRNQTGGGVDVRCIAADFDDETLTFRLPKGFRVRLGDHYALIDKHEFTQRNQQEKG